MKNVSSPIRWRPLVFIGASVSLIVAFLLMQPQRTLAPGDDQPTAAPPATAEARRAACTYVLPGADDPDEFGCPTTLDHRAATSFVQAEHETRYDDFWLGQCRGGGFCVIDLAWFEVVEDAIADYPARQRSILRNRLWAIGRAVGYEWARVTDDRLITGADLRDYGLRLQFADDLPARLTELEAHVCALLGPDAIEGNYMQAENCTVQTANR